MCGCIGGGAAQVGVCDPWPSTCDDTDGDGVADTSRIAGIQLLSGEEAVCAVGVGGGAEEVALTAYQRDNRAAAALDAATGLPMPYETVSVGTATPHSLPLLFAGSKV